MIDNHQIQQILQALARLETKMESVPSITQVTRLEGDVNDLKQRVAEVKSAVNELEKSMNTRIQTLQRCSDTISAYVDQQKEQAKSWRWMAERFWLPVLVSIIIAAILGTVGAIASGKIQYVP